MHELDLLLEIDPPLYMAKVKISCWRCGAEMAAVALVAPKVADTEGEVCILEEIQELPESVLQFLRTRIPSFRYRYSKTLNLSYYANTCPKCGVISGDFYLHSEPGAPFFPTEEEEARVLTLEEIPLAGRIVARATLAMGVGDLILTHARKVAAEPLHAPGRRKSV